jgi:hypothetical protein
VSETYTFRPATRDDLPMLRRWLETPEVVRWWGATLEQEELLREDLDNRKRPANPAFRIAAARENVCPLTGKLRGSYDDGYGSSRS